MALDVENNDRDYLFGRLLAIADVLERSALDLRKQDATNAIRYMNAFSNILQEHGKPFKRALQPYQARLGEKDCIYKNH